MKMMMFERKKKKCNHGEDCLGRRILGGGIVLRKRESVGQATTSSHLLDYLESESAFLVRVTRDQLPVIEHHLGKRMSTGGSTQRSREAKALGNRHVSGQGDQLGGISRNLINDHGATLAKNLVAAIHS